MTCICDPFLRTFSAFKDAITRPCTTREDDQPLAESSVHSNNSNEMLEDAVIERDLGLTNRGFDNDSFTSSLERTANWKPVLRLHGDAIEPHMDSGFMEIDLGDGAREDTVDGGVTIPGARRTDSRSTTRESGLGRSLNDSNGSSSPEPAVVSVSFRPPPNPGTYKVVVSDEVRCWFVLRRYPEFKNLHIIILNRVRGCGLELPAEENADRYNLNAFIQKVMADPRIVTIAEVREFLQLDRFRSSSSSSGSDSSSSPSTPSVILDPRFLMPPGAPPPARKPIPTSAQNGHLVSNGSSDGLTQLDNQQNIELGCTRKSLSPSDFEFLTVVGKGSFGRVLLARYHHDNKVYAVKMLNKKLIVRRNETAHVLSERSVLIKMLNHPYLVQLHFAFTTTHKIFFVLDYVNGGELFFHLQRERLFSEGRARFYAAEICCALSYMHSQGIVYRDLKPENILLDAEGHIVLTDFGLCKEGLQSSTSRTATFCGTPEYLAPEILKKQPYSRAVDWWTLGAVLYEMLYGLPPFYSRDTPAMYDAILHKPLKLKHSVSPKARSILQGLLQKDPRDRLGAGVRDGDDVKEHDFFRTTDWKLVDCRGLKPPFVPVVKGDDDTGNVDPIFTKDTVTSHSTSPTTLSASVQAVDHIFKGFSYAPPLEIEAQ